MLARACTCRCCFAPRRGDELDHHTLDLMLGHLAALWRTVLRQEDLERAAGHDALTGLPNRRTFEAELRRRIGLSKRRGLGFTLAMVDLDHFKLVNDSFGHPEGDAVLRRAGEAIRLSLRGSDRIFRLGGEEFVLLLETTDDAGVDDLLNRAREAVKALGVEPTPGKRTSASIGWAVYPDDADDRVELMDLADKALYQAKESGPRPGRASRRPRNQGRLAPERDAVSPRLRASAQKAIGRAVDHVAVPVVVHVVDHRAARPVNVSS